VHIPGEFEGHRGVDNDFVCLLFFLLPSLAPHQHCCTSYAKRDDPQRTRRKLSYCRQDIHCRSRGRAGKRSSESTCCGLGRGTGPSVQGFAPRPRQRPSHTSTHRRAVPPEVHRLRSLNTQGPSNERGLRSRVEIWLEDTDPRPLTEEEGGRAMSYSGSTSLQQDPGEGAQITPGRSLPDWPAESVPYQRSPETGAASTTQTHRAVRSSAKAYAGPTGEHLQVPTRPRRARRPTRSTSGSRVIDRREHPQTP